MQLRAISGLLLTVILPVACLASEPLRPDSTGVVKEIFNPDKNAATYGKWHSSKIGGGGYILSIAMNPSNTDIVYAFSDVGGIFRSDDSGRNWRMIHNTIHPQSLDCVRDLLVNPDNPAEIIAAVGTQWAKQQGIYKSVNGGENWKKVLDCQVFGNGPNRSMGAIIQRSPKDKNTIYAAPGLDGFFVSRDAGETWENLGEGKHYIYDFKIDKNNTDMMFLCADEKTLSHRKDWHSHEKVKLEGGFLRSKDAGKSWKKIADNAPWEMVQSPFSPNRWYAIFDGMTIKYSDDNGENWTEDSTGLALADTKQKPNSGKSYKAIVAGPDFLVVGSGAGDFYIKKSADDAWNKIEHEAIQGQWYARSEPGKWDHFGRACSSIVIDPKNPKHWFFTDWYSIYQTWDSGKHWTLTIDGIENTVIHTVTQTPSDPGTVHMGMADNGYFRSTDGATSFKLGSGAPDNCKAVAVAPSNTNTIYALAPKEHGWYANTLFASLDAGKNFTRSPMTNIPQSDKIRVNSLCVDYKNPKKVFIAVSGKVTENNGGVWVSDNRGGIWKWDSKGLPQNSDFFETSIWGSGYQISRSPNNAMVVIKGNAAYFRNSDDEPWKKSDLTPKSSGTRFVQVLNSPDEGGVFYITEIGNGLLKSDDNGKNWKKILDDGIHFATIDADNGKRIAVALDQARGLKLTTDGGKNWKEIDSSIPQRQRFKMAFSGDRLVVGTPGNGVFYLPLTDDAQKYILGKEVTSSAGNNIAKFGSCDDGTKGWYKWGSKGDIKISSEETGLNSGKGIKITAEGNPVKGTVSLPFNPKRKILVSGYVACKGEQECKIALQYFDKKGKQAGWLDILKLKNNGQKTFFSKKISVPEKAYKANLTMVISAPGEIVIDDISVNELPEIFE